jgi:dTMP kinase
MTQGLLAALRSRPLFIVFEGIDGSGKSTQARMLAEALTEADVPCILTAEPSDGPFGVRIRALDHRPPLEEEVDLFTEDRRDHVERVIAPALRKGQTVICDRYVYSSVAYQGARGMDPLLIISANEDFALVPDLVFLVEIAVPDALERIARDRPSGFSVFEARRDLEGVDAVYRTLRDPVIRRINGARPRDHIRREILEVLTSLVTRRGEPKQDCELRTET